jgi:predicted GIY-YIG superfamily endonuclease
MKLCNAFVYIMSNKNRTTFYIGGVEINPKCRKLISTLTIRLETTFISVNKSS